MKKIFAVLMISVFTSMPVWADTISEDKSDFAEISSVIDDAAFDIRYYSPNNFKISSFSKLILYSFNALENSS